MEVGKGWLAFVARIFLPIATLAVFGKTTLLPITVIETFENEGKGAKTRRFSLLFPFLFSLFFLFRFFLFRFFLFPFERKKNKGTHFVYHHAYASVCMTAAAKQLAPQAYQ